MNHQLLIAIAILCQVTGTYGSKSIAMIGGYHDREVVQMEFSYEEAKREQLKCQKYFVKCFKNGKNMDDCVLERK
jgi:hypothetical protein